MEEFLLWSPLAVLVSLAPVGLQRRPGLGVVAAAVWRSLSLTVLPKNICSSSQEEPEGVEEVQEEDEEDKEE